MIAERAADLIRFGLDTTTDAATEDDKYPDGGQQVAHAQGEHDAAHYHHYAIDLLAAAAARRNSSSADESMQERDPRPQLHFLGQPEVDEWALGADESPQEVAAAALVENHRRRRQSNRNRNWSAPAIGPE